MQVQQRNVESNDTHHLADEIYAPIYSKVTAINPNQQSTEQSADDAKPNVTQMTKSQKSEFFRLLEASCDCV